VDPLEKALLELQAEQKASFARLETKADEQFAKSGNVTSELKEEFDRLVKRYDDLEVRVASARSKVESKSVFDFLREDEPLQRFMKDRSGTCRVALNEKHAAELFAYKTTVTTGTGTGYAAAGVLEIDRDPGVVYEARRMLKMRNVIPARPTAFGKVYWVKVNAPMTKASPVAEGLLKPENQMTFTTVGETLRVIATFITASRQVLEDWGELMGILQTSLRYEVDKEDDRQILHGDGTGENYDGLITQATAYTTGLTGSAAFNRADQIGRAIQQIASADETEPGFVVMNPADWWNVRLTKDSNGNYIFGSPSQRGAPGLFDLTPIVTTAIGVGKFLVGSSQAAAAEIRDGFGTEVEISTQHDVNFTKNLITIRAERRSLLTVKRPGAFIYGTFATSPAS